MSECSSGALMRRSTPSACEVIVAGSSNGIVAYIFPPGLWHGAHFRASRGAICVRKGSGGGDAATPTISSAVAGMGRGSGASQTGRAPCASPVRGTVGVTCSAAPASAATAPTRSIVRIASMVGGPRARIQ
jgi:hypothetical protein